MFLVVTGQVLVKPDVTPEDVEQVLPPGRRRAARVPRARSGLIQAKTSQLVGQSKAYPALGRADTGSLTMDKTFLTGLEDGTELVILARCGCPKYCLAN